MSKNIIEQLEFEVRYAKSCGMPQRELYKAYGRITMAFELGAINKDEYFELNHQCVYDGINNPQYYDENYQSKVINEIELRLCKLNGDTFAHFHKWIERTYIISESIAIGGHNGGSVCIPLALVELNDGIMQEVYPAQIQFIDSKGKNNTDKIVGR